MSVKAYAWSVSTTGSISLRYQKGKNLGLLNPGVQYSDEAFSSAYLMPEVDLSQGGWFDGALELYTSELSRRTFSYNSLNLYGVENVNDYFNDTHFIRKAYVSFNPSDSITLSAGEMHIIGGSSLIFDNYQPSITFDYDMTDTLNIPLSYELNIVKVEPYMLYDPSRTSMFYDNELTYSFSLFEYITLFYANFDDTDNTLAPLLNGMIYSADFNRETLDRLSAVYGKVKAAEIETCIQEEYSNGGPVTSSRTNINWAGLTGDKYFGELEFNVTGVLDFGNGSISGVNCFSPNVKPVFNRDFLTYGYLGDAKIKYHIDDIGKIGLFFNISSGDKTPMQAIISQGTLNSFMSVFPYNTETDLFFNGGINQNLNSGTIAIAGRNGLGIVAYGGIMDFYPVKSIEFTITPALLYPEMTADFYGFETDFTFTYTINKHVSFPFEFDYFKAGDYFKYYSSVSLAQVLFGADITW